MTRPPIEFLLHPPSPKPTFTLPPVSSLLSNVTPPPLPHASSSSPICQQDLPSIPSLRLPDKEFPSLMLSIPYNDPPSNTSSPTCSPHLSYHSALDTPQSSPTSSPHHPFLLPPPDTLNRSRSHSNASTSSWSSVATSAAVTAPSSPIHMPERRLSDPFMYQQQDDHHHHHHHQQTYHHQRPQSASPSLSPLQVPPCPSTSTSSTSSSSDPVVKRKRGRPPNTNRQVQRDHWTFVTPTVWDVKRTQLPEHLIEEENHHDHHASSYSPNSIFSDPSLSPSLSSSSTSSLSSSSSPPHHHHHHHEPSSSSSSTGFASKNGVMLVLWPHDNSNGKNGQHQNLNTFTNSSMDTTLTMPKKKRGRKPKTQLVGNSCFVWRDLTAKRGANRLKTPPTPSTTTTSSSSHLLPANRTNLRISKKQQPYAHSHHHQRNKTVDDDIIGWTKDLSLNDRSN